MCLLSLALTTTAHSHLWGSRYSLALSCLSFTTITTVLSHWAAVVALALALSLSQQKQCLVALSGCARTLDESVSNRLSTTADWKRSKRDLSSAEM